MRPWEPNFTWITPHLAVGGSFPVARTEHLARVLAIRAVVDLREECCDDATLLEKHAVTFLHLPTEDHCAVSQEMLCQGVAFANRHLDRDEKVLIHCEYGVGRSVTLALCVLVSRGMPPLEALRLAKDRRPAVSPSRVQFEAWAAWLKTWRKARSAPWTIPDYDSFCAIAYRHLFAPES